MKKEIVLVALSLASLCAMADNVPGMVIAKTDGSKVDVAISDIQSIKFGDGNMIVNKKDNSKQILSLDDISAMEFGDITSAINAIVGTDNHAMTITDINGRVVYTCASDSNSLPTLLPGLYIINVDGRSHKIVIK